MAEIPAAWQWFNEARFGMFIHWGPYSLYGRGEQVLFREHLDQAEYARVACGWRPERYDPTRWAAVAAAAGMKYAVLTTRHHDGFCLWDSQLTDYTAPRQAAGRDLVGEYVEAFRAAGLRVGLYYSLADWRIPAYWNGPEVDPEGWAEFQAYVHGQVAELLSNYGKIDVIWFDGAWPHDADRWGSAALVDQIRALQPDILINNRLGTSATGGEAEGAGKSRRFGDFGTPEHHITAEHGSLWESCQVSTWRLWGYTIGEQWRPPELLLDFLVECAGKGGNLLLNVGPTPHGELPAAFCAQMRELGGWMATCGEAIYGSEAGDVCEFITVGRQIRRGDCLYLVCRFWDGRGAIRLAGLATQVVEATLLNTGQAVAFDQTGDELVLSGLPMEPPGPLFPVIRLKCDGPPQAAAWAVDRLWGGDPQRMAGWAAARGSTVWADGGLPKTTPR